MRLTERICGALAGVLGLAALIVTVTQQAVIKYNGSAVLLTLRTRYSATGSRFIPAGIPASPRRRCPRQKMFLAAFSSRSRIRPQCGQTWVRTDRLVEMRSPPPEQSCEVYAGGTASPRLPAHAAV